MKIITLSLKIFLVMTILTGIAYPLLVTGVAQVAFPSKANGSLITKDNKIIGSELIGQQFDSCIYFTSRPSAINYDAACSGASNLSMTSAKLHQQVEERRKTFLRFNELDSTTAVPTEMLNASASGLDPHISVKAALLQVNRIAKARQMKSLQKEQLVQLIDKNATLNTTNNQLRRYINVLQLNLQLDALNPLPIKQ